MEKDFERLDMETNNINKKWSPVLVVITIAFVILFEISPVACFGFATSISSVIVSLALLVVCFIYKKKYKMLPLIILNIIVVITNILVLGTHILNYTAMH